MIAPGNISAGHLERSSFGVSARILSLVLVFTMVSGCSPKSENSAGDASGPATRVVNLSTDEYDVYIGRRSSPRVHMLTEGVRPGEEGWLGNPHPIGRCDLCGEDHSRDECIEAFRKDFYEKLERDPDFRKAVLELKGKRLGCYCKPKNCHGDVVREFIESGE